MRRAICFGLTAVLVLLPSCSDDKDKSEFEGKNNGGSSGSAGNAGSGGSAASGGSSSGGFAGLPDSGSGGSAGTGTHLNTPVNVIITADNAYGFGYGTGTQILNYFGGVENVNSTDIFDCPIGHGPEEYTVPASSANAGNYLYIIGYADKNFTQGVIAKFSREGGAPVYTGSGPWQACATGQDFDVGGGGPKLADINAQLINCNAANTSPTTTSVGWVSTTPGERGHVVFGETNNTDRPNDQHPVGNEFEIVCGIEPAAHWMWYDWIPFGQRGDAGATQSPFIWPGGSANTDREFIIFRLGAEFVPDRPD